MPRASAKKKAAEAVDEFEAKDDAAEAELEQFEEDEEEDKPKTAPARNAAAKGLKAAEEEEEQSLADWLRSYGSEGPVRITLERKYPDKFRGIQVAGVLGTYDEYISTERVEQEHGGGKFTVRVMRQHKTKSGAVRWVYAGARTFKVAGAPRIDNLQHEDERKSSEARPSSEVTQVLRTAQDLVDRANARADRAQDPAMLEAVLGPMRMQMQELAAQNRVLQERLIEKMGEKPDTSREDNVLKLWGKSTDEQNTRLSEAHARHEAELRQMRDFHQEEIRRREERSAREMERAHDDAKMRVEIMRSNHQQSIDSLRTAHEQSLTSMRSAYDMRIAGLEDTVRRLEAEKAEARQELITLRAKKEQGPLEQVQALAALKNGMESVFGGGKDDEDDTPTWLKALQGLGVDNLVAGVGNRIAGPAGGAPEPQEPMVTIQGPNGETAQVPQHVADEYRRRQAQQQVEQQGTRLDPNAVRRALSFMESSYKNGTEPGDFARSAKSMIPQDILQMLSERGPEAGADHILDEYAEPNSALNQVNGRQWARKVVRFLLRGTTDEPNGEATAPPASPPPPAGDQGAADEFADL